jgi:hypothetical protein
MPTFQLIECMVALGGDEQQIVHRGGLFAVTYPELIVLQFVHGDEAVTDAYEQGTVERENADELARLRAIYSKKVCQDIFPGANPRLPPADSRIRPRIALTPPRRKRAPSRVDYTDPAFQPQIHDGLAPPAGDVDTLHQGE